MQLKSYVLVFSVVSLFGWNAAVAQNTSISVDKQGSPNPIVAGTDITYAIAVSSEGPADALSAVLNDPLPAGTTFASLASPATWSCTTPLAGSGGTVSCSRASFPPGSEFFTLVLHTDPALTHGSTLSNTATISTTTNDPDQNDNVSTAVTPVQARSNLGITKSAAPDPAPIGGSATFTIGYSATGPSSAANATITDVLPPGTLFNSVSAPGWSCVTPASGNNGTVTCTTLLAPGASGTITIVVTIAPSTAPGTQFTNTATITGDVIDSVSANNSASATITALHISNLAITKNAAPNPVPAGSAITYTIGVSASGPSAAPNVAMDDVLPAGTTFTSLSAPAGWSCTMPAVGASGSVNCTHPAMASGESGAFTLVAGTSSALPAGTAISNTATISGSVVETTADNSATANVTTSVVSDLGVTKTAPATIFAGSSMTYSIAYSAVGPSSPSGVTIADALPASTTFSSIAAPGFTCTTPAVGSSGAVSCTAVTLAPGASGTITIVVAVGAGVAPATVIANTATVSSAAGDTNATNDSSTATTTVSAPPITGSKTATPSAIVEGSNVTYTIVLHNGGAFTQGDNPGDELVDVLPPSLTLVTASATSGTAAADVPNNTVRWNGSIAPGADVTITIIATIRFGFAGTTVSNQATIRFDGDNNGTNESATLSAAPGGGPTLFAVLSATTVPTLSPAVLIALAALLMAIGWKAAMQ